MPPKVKTGRDAVLAAAFAVALADGISAVTAQQVSTHLGTSVAPIFRSFQTVEELRCATVEEVHRFHTQYLSQQAESSGGFLGYGLAYIRFAGEYPRLFEALTHPAYNPPGNFPAALKGPLAFLLESVAKEGSIPPERAEELFYHLWIYAHGVACLIAQGGMPYAQDTVAQLLRTAFFAFLQSGEPTPLQ